MSSGHLCGAEAPTEPEGENAGVQWTLLQSKSTDRAGRQNVKGFGGHFPNKNVFVATNAYLAKEPTSFFNLLLITWN